MKIVSSQLRNQDLINGAVVETDNQINKINFLLICTTDEQKVSIPLRFNHSSLSGDVHDDVRDGDHGGVRGDDDAHDGGHGGVRGDDDVHDGGHGGGDAHDDDGDHDDGGGDVRDDGDVRGGDHDGGHGGDDGRGGDHDDGRGDDDVVLLHHREAVLESKYIRQSGKQQRIPED
ncbi:hypothetical protein NPIL_629771 [Nephila pilipes]|uniref:Uncharacterized protein n=1 Tax=Nephila pilipes TaxID=299642 RepID=A0A8X6QDU4_NEPPI|nr:hypothetical protein NPIL_629771 [Nephila pilipes]